MIQHGQRCALILAGGTGGHVFPALALALDLRARGWRVVWLGTAQGIEAGLVPFHRIQFERVGAAGVRGKRGWRRWSSPLRMLWACGQSLLVLLRQRPDVVVGFGGYAAFPGGVAALLLLRPLVLHEQNAVAGSTNRLLAPWANRVLEGFPGSFKAPTCSLLGRVWPAPRSVRWIGNPVRPEIAALAAPARRFAERQGPLRVLVLGGSQGAQALNRLVPQALALLPRDQRPLVLHQGGVLQITALRASYAAHEVEARLVPFIEDMAGAYAESDLVICRSGALTVAELAAAGVGSLLVPFPSAVDDHQTVNARFLEECGAARIWAQSLLDPAELAGWLGGLTRGRLVEMAVAARTQARVEATDELVRVCEELAA